jgi:hypothetical protein
MSRLNIIGIDLAKTNFYLFSLSPEGKPGGRIKLSREKLIGWFTTQSRMIVAMEACGALITGPEKFKRRGMML